MSGMLFGKADFSIRHDKLGKEYFGLAIILLLGFVLSFNKNTLYSMGQDQGTYQVRAMVMMSGNYDNRYSLPEYEGLETDEQRQKYLDFVYGQNNLYLPRVEWETDSDARNIDKIEGAIHGLPTYSVLLALWGVIFGLSNMMGVQTIGFLASIVIMWFACENIGLKKETRFLATFSFMLSPICIWLAKSSLTETWLTLLFAMFVYFLTDKEDDLAPCLTCVPLVVFSFFHISLFAFMPIFVISLWAKYLYEEKSGYLISAIVTVWGYFLGTLWAVTIAPYYSYGNYTELFHVLRFVNDGNLIGFIGLVCVICTVITVLLGVKPVKNQYEGVKAFFEKNAKCLWVVLKLFLILCVAYFCYKGFVGVETHTAVEYLQISAYIYLSGMIAIPVIVCIMFFLPDRVFSSVNHSLVAALFLYGIMFYSCVMRVRIPHYYYYARYSALMLPIIFILLGFILDGFDKKVLTRGVWMIIILSFLPYCITLARGRDHSRADWEYVENMAASMESDSALIIAKEELEIIFDFPLKTLTGCDIYYYDAPGEGLEQEIDFLLDRYNHVYVMNYSSEFEQDNISEYSDNWTASCVFRKNNRLEYFDYFNIDNPITPIPLKTVRYELDISLYDITSKK